MPGSVGALADPCVTSKGTDLGRRGCRFYLIFWACSATACARLCVRGLRLPNSPLSTGLWTPPSQHVIPRFRSTQSAQVAKMGDVNPPASLERSWSWWRWWGCKDSFCLMRCFLIFWAICGTACSGLCVRELRLQNLSLPPLVSTGLWIPSSQHVILGFRSTQSSQVAEMGDVIAPASLGKELELVLEKCCQKVQ